MEDKIVSREELASKVEDLRGQGKVVGFTSGAFDILHAGHVSYLRTAKEKCDVLIVGVNTDESVKEYKDALRPIVPLEQRMQVVAGLESVDYVFSFSERRNRANIEALKPSLYIKAGDYKPEELTSSDVVKEYGGDVLIVPMESGISTSNVINTIVSRYGNKDVSKNEDVKSAGETREMQKAILIDRDGTINEDIEYLHEPDQFKLLPNAAEGLKAFQDLGYKIVIITLQAGIGLGYFQKEDFYRVNRQMFAELAAFDITIDKIYFATHSKTEDGQNPKKALIERAREELDLDLAQSIAIGDKTTDLEPAAVLSMKTIGVKTGKGLADGKVEVTADYMAEDLLDAAKWAKEEA